MFLFRAWIKEAVFLTFFMIWFILVFHLSSPGLLKKNVFSYNRRSKFKQSSPFFFPVLSNVYYFELWCEQKLSWKICQEMNLWIKF